ncbi:MAG: hypothetical protein ABIP17_03415, partial [Ilumatobacteraceae bacterium]
FIDDVAAEISQIGVTLDVRDVTVPAATLAAELALELNLVVRLLRVVIDTVTAADVGRPVRALEYTGSQLDSLLLDLAESRRRGVGATGSTADARRHLARVILGPADVPTPPVGVANDADWEARHVTGVVLDAATGEQARTYWLLLDEGAKDRAIVEATPPVSDRYLAGEIWLDLAQIFLMQTVTIPSQGRRPASGPNTDWAGVEIPKAAPADDLTAPESEWAYDQELRAFLGGSVVCSAIQVLSAIPSKPGTDRANGAIAAGGIIRDAANAHIPIGSGAASGPGVLAAVAMTLADVALCRLGVGSGAPIDTSRVVNDNGVEVYAGSRDPDQKYMTNGLPLDSDPQRRDEQMWRSEHSNQLGYLMEPYPGFPAYGVNTPGH